MLRQQARAQKEAKTAEAQQRTPEAEALSQPEATAETSQRTSAFSEEALQAAWRRFFEEQTLSQAEKAFARRPVSKGEGAVVQVALRNILEHDMLENYRERLLSFLRRELDNPTITLAVKESKKKQAPRRQLSREEQLQLLSQKYPMLEELRQRLGLDFD